MAVWRPLLRGFRALTRWRTAAEEATDEVRHYLDESIAAHLARGLTPAQARRAAQVELGSIASLEEQVRGYGWEHVVETALADLLYAARRLRSAPAFTIAAVTTLALGIGATTAIFSAVRPILFDPLPYPDGDRLAMILEPRGDGGRNDGTFALYQTFVERSRSFEHVAAFKAWRPTVTGEGGPEQLQAQRVTASYFDVLGIPPLLGRNFIESEDRPNAGNVVILSDHLWRRRFRADPAIVGRQVTIDDTGYSVIGVMPAGFENILSPAAELWAPLQYDITQGRAWGHHLHTVGRLRPGVEIAVASDEIDALGRALVREQRPETYSAQAAFAVTSLHDEVTAAVRPALLAVLGAAALVLMIAWVNVTNLLLARGVNRRGEFALRAALGAGRNRLLRQLLTESLLLAAIGGVTGVAVAAAAMRTLVAMAPAGLPRIAAIGLDGALLGFALCLTAIIGLAVGITPALQSARRYPQGNLQPRARTTGSGHHRLRRALVVAEIALALVLLVSSGLLLRSLERLFAVDSGFNASGVLTMQVHTAGKRFEDENAVLAFFDAVLDRVRQVPGVASASLTSQLPISGDSDEYGVHFESNPEGYNSYRYAVSPGYLEAMRIPLRRGRLLDARDRSDAPPVALISESLANRRFPGADPLGQRLTIGPTDGPPYTIVGVVGDVRQMSLARSESDAVYTTSAQWRFTDRVMSLVVRGQGDVAALAPAIRQAVWSVDKDQPIVRVATMSELLATSAAERRFLLVLFEAFALTALVLAAAGIYGVLAGGVAERTREIGVRAALGATRGNILGLIVGQGMSLTGIGIVVGLVGAVISTRALVTLLFGVSRLDPPTYLGVVVLLGAVAVAASVVPAWRAVRVDPASTLRAE